MRESVLEDFVVPICRAEITPKSAILKRLIGTAFFIDNNGTFITAKHIVETIETVLPQNIQYGLNIKTEKAPPTNIFAELFQLEYAPRPFDIAIGRIKTKSRGWFEVNKSESVAG